MLTISLFPIPIHADSITSANIIGVEKTINQYELINTGNNYNVVYCSYDLKVLLDDYYIGWVSGTAETKYYYYDPSSSSSSLKNAVTPSKTYYVNGNYFYMTLDFRTQVLSGSYNEADPSAVYNATFNLNLSNVTKYQDIDSLEQVINILADNQQYISDIYDELIKVVSNTNISNSYLETLTDFRHWNIPTESLSANSMWLSQTFVDNNELQLLSFYQIAYNYYPIYKLLDKDCDGAIFYANVSSDDPVTIIIISPNLSNSQWSNYVSITGSTVSNISTSTIKSSFNMQLPDDIGGATKAWYIRRWDITTSSRGAVLVDFTQDNTYFIPIYVGTKTQQQFIGTEFALNWGLSNTLLDNLNIIANGTSSSSSSSNDLDDTTSQFQTDANSLISIEDNFNSTMNSNLDNINPTFNMGSSFLASANWVSTQFNRIVNNTPFSSLITFGLTLGLGLLIIGKIRK